MGDFWRLAAAATEGEAGRPSAAGGLDPGLKRRMRGETRRLSSLHHQLDTFFDMVLEALERQSLQAARIAFTRFRDALESHITLEDEVFFPALCRLCPGLTDGLAELVEDHAEIQRQLEHLHDRLAEGSAEIFAADLDRFATRLAAHEFREERLVASVTEKPPDEGSGPRQPEED